MTDEPTSGLAGHLRGLEHGVYQYSCFLHIDAVGNSTTDRCAACDRQYGFILDDRHWPKQIAGRRVVDVLGRGFFGVVYKTEHARLKGKYYAVKVIPSINFAPKSEGGRGKNADREVELLQQLGACGVAPDITDAGIENLLFGDVSISCNYIEMEFIDGQTLADVVKNLSPPTVKTIAQIAYDLLEIVIQLEQRGFAHNDLHSQNVILEHKHEYDMRGTHMINPFVQVRVLDLGAADVRRAEDNRLTDIQWVGSHILSLLDGFESKASEVTPDDRRISAQLRRIAEHFVGNYDSVHQVNARDLQDSVVAAWSMGVQPSMFPVHLTTISSHINARTMPPWFTPELLYDPDDKWAKILTGPGTHLVYGMRGCGKTMLLRSLEWTARLHPRKQSGQPEKIDEIRNRVASDTYLGLFVSCGTLLKGMRPEVVDVPVQRTFLAFAREILVDAELSSVNDIGVLNNSALKSFAAMLQRHIAWVEIPHGFVLPSALIDAVNTAMRQVPTIVSDSFTPQAAFEELAIAAQELLDIWANKQLLFMLDDLSPRVLKAGTIEILLEQLTLFSSNFSFKVSTESQTLFPKTSGGKRAQSGREYIPFNLGEEVYKELGGRKGVEFIETILYRRQRLVGDAKARGPRVLLGSGRTLKTLALDIKSSSNGKRATGGLYFGVETLAAVCVGDISDALLLYHKMEQKAEAPNTKLPLRNDIQHSVFIDVAASKLRTLHLESDWLHRHAVAFAQAAHRELMRSSPSRPRRFGSVHVELPVVGGAELYEKLMLLVENGVYVLTGGNDRAKDPEDVHTLQVKLAYRNVFGLPSNIPLSRRDRFEITGLEELKSWLEDPDATKLKFGLLGATSGDSYDGAFDDDEAPVPVAPDFEQLDLFGLKVAPVVQVLNAPHSNSTVEVHTHTGLRDAPFDWQSAIVIGALGFEERGIGSWMRLAETGVRSAIALRYPHRGRADEIMGLLRKANVTARTLDVSSPIKQLTDNIAAAVDQTDPNAPVVVDITSLDKATIYGVIAHLLPRRPVLHLVYTEARDYWPPDHILKSVAARLRNNDDDVMAYAARTLNDRAFSTVALSDSRNPNAQTILAAPIPLKYARIESLLAEVNIDHLAAIVPVAEDRLDSYRDEICLALASRFVDQIGGEDPFRVGALDFKSVYQWLEQLHAKYALSWGYNFEVALTGDKMHTVAAAMLGSVTSLAAVYASVPVLGHNPDRFTEGYGSTFLYTLRRVPLRGDVDGSPSASQLQVRHGRLGAGPLG